MITNAERAHILEEEKIDYLAQCSFEKEIMQLEPEEFIRLLVENFHMKYLVCGTDFSFGRMGRGNAKMLEELSKTYGFTLEVVEKLQKDHRDISSTYVREEIAAGNIEKGNELLGYEYFVWGEDRTWLSSGKQDGDADDQSDPAGGQVTAEKRRLCDQDRDRASYISRCDQCWCQADGDRGKSNGDRDTYFGF